MFGLGHTELLVIMVIGLIIFGAKKLPEIASVSDKSILKKIGLRSHDKILAVNGKSIEGKNGAFEFFEKISEGKKVTIKYRRRNRTR